MLKSLIGKVKSNGEAASGSDSSNAKSDSSAEQKPSESDKPVESTEQKPSESNSEQKSEDGVSSENLTNAVGTEKPAVSGEQKPDSDNSSNVETQQSASSPDGKIDGSVLKQSSDSDKSAADAALTNAADPAAANSSQAATPEAAASGATLTDISQSPLKSISRESASMLNLLMEQIKALVEIGNNLNDRTKEAEKRINELTVENERFKEEQKQFTEKMEVMEKNMEKFIGLYEVVTNQYNPFLEASSNDSDEPDENADNGAIDPSLNDDSTSIAGSDEVVVEDKITGQTQPANPAPAMAPSTPEVTAPVEPTSDASSSGGIVDISKLKANAAPEVSAKDPDEAASTGGIVDISKMKSATSDSVPSSSETVPLTLANGKAISNLQDLFEELVYIDDNGFRSHVNDTKHDIADWIDKSLQNSTLAEVVKPLKTKSGVIKAIAEFIHSLPAESPTSTDLKLVNGKIVNDVEGLLDEIIYMDDAVLMNNFESSKSQIIDWVGDTLKISNLANELSGTTDKGSLIKIISKYLVGLNK